MMKDYIALRRMRMQVLRIVQLTILIISGTEIFGQETFLPEQIDRWQIQAGGYIEWKINQQLPHYDHIEMDGEKVALWMQYGVDSNAKPKLSRTIIFPTFRLLPVRTLAHMMYNVEDGDLPRILINDQLLKAGVYNAVSTTDMHEKATSIKHLGIMKVESDIDKEGLKLKRTFFPSVDKPVAIEKLVFINGSKQAVRIEMEYLSKEIRPAIERINAANNSNISYSKVYNIVRPITEFANEATPSFFITTINDGLKTVQPGDSVVFAITYQAVRNGEKPMAINSNNEEQKRKERVNQILNRLVLETPDNILNTSFAFAKIHATESIYNTKSGYMHGPGGLKYYAAIWANDQAEYVNPFFGFLGDTLGNKSAMNAYRLFAGYMNPEYNPLPSAIIAEGSATWTGAGDRGDMAMIAYGAGRFALAYGNADSAKVLWPLIEWCLEYCKRKLNVNGVVWSNKDELEGRFPAGNANLNTSSLYFDALRSAVMLGKQLGKSSTQLNLYQQEAKTMRSNIEKFFGATVEGYKTYRYYEGNDTLRAWITTPLVMDIFERKEGTIAALFSSRLWTEDGLATLAGNKIFWDRSTLYGLRGAFAAGETEKALRFLKYYSKRRLLGEHVPYPVEAYPEGNQRQLSAESGLYCRIYTEGLFGMRPTGFNSFTITPRLPKKWDQMALRNINAFQNQFDIEVSRTEKNKLLIKIGKDGKTKTYFIEDGASQEIQL
jgi:hypothetical protein